MSDILKADLNALKVLDVLLDECSVSQAAKRLHVTLPPVHCLAHWWPRWDLR